MMWGMLIVLFRTIWSLLSHLSTMSRRTPIILGMGQVFPQPVLLDRYIRLSQAMAWLHPLLWQKCWSSSSSIHIGLNMTDVCIWWVHDKWIQMAAFGIHNYICIYWWITFKYNAYRISKIVFYIWSFLQRIGWLSTVSECPECGSVMILLLSCIACPYSFHTRSFCLKL